MFTWLDWVFFGIALIGVLIVVIDHFHFKPKRIKRQKLLERLYKEGIDEILKSIKGEN